MRLFRRYFGHVDEAIVILNQSTQGIVFLNMEAEDLFDVDWKEVSGRPMTDIVDLNFELSTCSQLKSYRTHIRKNNMKVNLQCFTFKCDMGDFIGCIINAKQLIPIKELLVTNKYPIGIIRHQDDIISWENYNKAFGEILSLDQEKDPLNYLNHQFTLQKKDSWSGTTAIRYENTMQKFDVNWLDLDQNYRVVYLEQSASLNEQVNLLDQIQNKLEESEMDISSGRIIRIDFSLNHTNNKLLMDFIGLVQQIIENYFKSIQAQAVSVLYNKSLNIFTDSKNKDLIDLPFMILKNTSIERLEFKNNCNLKIRISVSEAQNLSLQIINQAHELKTLFEDGEYNDIYFFSHVDTYKRKLAIHHNIQKGLENEEFVLYAQKIVDIEKGHVEGCEILVRWQHPQYGLLLPDEFLDYAEKTGDIVRLDLYVIKRTFEYVYDHFNELKSYVIHINLSNQTLASKQFIELVFGDKYNHIKPNIVFELIEDQDSPVMDKVINQLRHNGYELAIDDFGKGYSSFERIRNIGIEYIKIDKSFIDGLTENVDDLLILEAIIGMCNNLKIKVIAEGIETQGQLEFLYARKCMRIQGFIFAKPEPIEQLLDSVLEKADSVKEICKQLKSDEIESKKFYNNNRIIRQDIDIDFNLITPSAILSEILGYDYSDFQKKSFIDLLPTKLVHSFKIFLKNFEENRQYKAIMIELNSVDGELLRGICVVQKHHASVNYQVYIELVDKNSEFELLGLSHSYLQAFEEAPSGMMIISSGYKIKNWNQSCERIFGHKAANVFDENIIKLLSVPSEKQAFTLMFQKALKGNIVERVVKNKNASGEIRIIRWRVDILYDELQEVQEYICIANDITDDIKRNEELSRVNKALDQSQSIIIMTDTQGYFEYVNNKFYEVTGYIPDEIIGKHVEILASKEDDKDTIKSMWEQLNEGKVWHGEFHNQKKDGSYFWTKSSIYPIIQDEVITGFVSIQVDVTEHKALENLNTQLKQKLFEQEKIASVGMLSSGIMHEINNPLSFINGNVIYILDSMVNYKNLDDEDFEDIIEALKDVETGLNQIKTIASGLKKFIFKGGGDEREPVDLIEEIKTILVISKNEYKYHANVKMIYEEEVSYKVFGYASKLKQVFMNLIINASHAIASMEKETLGLITIQLMKVKEQLIIKVIDDGCGISNQVIQRIFEPFYTTKGEGIGSGLGLSVTRQIIEDDHDGTILCESEMGVGTSFIIKLKAFD